MPTNKKEGIIFTSLMCFLMVLGMSAYNLVLHDSFSLAALLHGLIPGLVVAFVLDTFIVGVAAKKIAFALPLDPEKKLPLIIAISFLMVLGMVSFMSLFGLLMQGSLPAAFGSAYLHTWRMNFVVALPYQLLLVGPFSRWILGRLQNSAAVAAESTK